MAEEQERGASPAGPGVLGGLAGIAKNMFGLLVNRIELAALELGEIRAGLAKLLLVCAFGLIAAWFAIAWWSVLIVALAWDAWGWKILLLVAVVFTLLALAIFLYARALLARGKLSMSATIAELRKDRDALL